MAVLDFVLECFGLMKSGSFKKKRSRSRLHGDGVHDTCMFDILCPKLCVSCSVDK
jgi:hypothetical protein